jgi:hypothetical protein
MTPQARFLIVGFGALLAACASPPPPGIGSVSIPSRDLLYEPERVTPGRLEYAPDRTTFAPVLTEKFPYPTQTEANDAYRRLLGETLQVGAADSIWVFGCKPGAFDAQTARVARYHGPLVHCATDFLDASGRGFARVTANFAYHNSVWNMEPVYPPVSPVLWRSQDGSPRDRWWWVPWRDRYE